MALVERVGAEHREHVVAHELFAQVLDEDVGGLDAEEERLLARRPQLSREPLQLGFDCRCLWIMQKSGKQGHRGAQPAQADPHLMHALRISFDGRRHVVNDLLQAGAADHLKTVTCARACSQIDRDGPDRRAELAVDKFISALRFALEGELGREHMHEFARNAE